MYLSAERLALANQTIHRIFEQTCVAWQAIPHWDVGDPGQTQVFNGDTLNPLPLTLAPAARDVPVTVGEIIAPTPDALLTKITAGAVGLALDVDTDVLPKLRDAATAIFDAGNGPPNTILNALIAARVSVESAGFRAPTALITDTVGLQALHQLVGGSTSVKDSLLDAGNINSLYRFEILGAAAPGPPSQDVPVAGHVVRGIVLGRRQRIAPGYACEVSPGEEPVDLAVSIPPSLEVVGETAANTIALRVRLRYALRVKLPAGVVVISGQ